MTLNQEIVNSINSSILCWLATSSAKNIPNVSPKEIFSVVNNESIIVANIASPQTEKNILENNEVCICFLDILKQKGQQLKGTAKVVKPTDSNFGKLQEELEKQTKGAFKINSIFEIKINSQKPLLAPSYIFHSKTKEEDQINSAKQAYGL